jgi:hypothetical protein
MSRRQAKGRALVLVLLLMLLALLGEAGHVLLDQLNFVLAHHFFHLVFPLVAFMAFAIFVANDIRLRGWPTFSWRLRTKGLRTED